MADPNRPVTGYPAPNPQPNGYSANPPASGTAYAYAAAPPPNAYYNNPYYQQNYQPDADAFRRATCLRRVFAFIMALVIIFGTMSFIVWLVLRPQLPEFQVDSVSFSNFTLDNNSRIFFTSEMRLTARNPNKKMSLLYDAISAGIFYDSAKLAETNVPPFSQGTKTDTPLTADFAAAGSFVGGSVVNHINGERSRNGNVEFNLRIVSFLKFQTNAWRTRWRYLRVFCGNLVVGFPSNGRSGTLSGGPRQCRVGY